MSTSFAAPSLEGNSVTAVHPSAGSVDENVALQQSSLAYGNHRQQQQMACLYTKHKTQKRKLWNDGRLVLQANRAVLYDAHPTPGSGDPALGECEISTSQREAIVRQLEVGLQTEQFLIQVEGPWVATTRLAGSSVPTKTVSQGMKKVMNKKFKKPGKFIPKHPSQDARNQRGVRQRAPLQPGQLQRQYYGDAAVSNVRQQVPLQPPFPTARPQNAYQQSYPPNHQRGQSTQYGASASGAPQGNWRAPNNESQRDPASSQFPQAPSTHPLPTEGFQGTAQHSMPNASFAITSTYTQPPPAALNPPQPPESHAASRSNPRGCEPKHRNPFISNGFNAQSSYFGEEEESEDESDGNFAWNKPTAVQTRTHPTNSAPQPLSHTNQENQTENATTSEREDSTGTDTAGLPHQSETAEGPASSEALSKTELLSLFGAGNQVASLSATSPTKDSESGEIQGVPQEGNKKQFEFELPSASESSSDDEEGPDE